MIVLSNQELYEITHKRRYKAQARELALRGIPHEFRSDGSLLVYRRYFDGQAKEEGQASPALCDF
jgi:hypothetical protein